MAIRRAAIGIRAHSGWGAVVVLSDNLAPLDLIERRRVEVIDPQTRGAKQPYHFAETLDLPDAEKHLADCAATAERLAHKALGAILSDARKRDLVVTGCALLLASGRELPPLPQILKSHALIHTAEGEFFRRAFRNAIERLKIPLVGIRERDLNVRADALFGDRAAALQHAIAELGKSVGPPWTADQKAASLGALLALADPRRQAIPTP